MAKAQAIQRSPAEDTLDEAGAGMLMLVSGSVWETLLMQARHEGRTPGEVLGRALNEYVQKHGPEDLKAILAGRPR